jgi:acetylornithine deacetylase
LGSSAIDKLLAALANLRQVSLPSDPVLGESTLNVGTLSGGRAANVIADHAKAEVMLRTVGDTSRLKADLLASVAAVPDVAVAELRETPAVHMAALPVFETTIVRYTTDVPHLTAWGQPFLLGPGTIHVAHTPDEQVRKSELVAAVGLYKEMAYRL